MTTRIVSSVDLDISPSISLFYQSLSLHNIEWVGKFELTPQWIKENADSYDALHFHWPEFLLRSLPGWTEGLDSLKGGWKVRRAIRRIKAITRLLQYNNLIRCLRVARRLGKKIIWTLHNIEPHEDGSKIQRAAFRHIARASDLIICHDSHSRDECLRIFDPLGDVVLMPRGNHDGAFPAPREQEQVRQELGVPVGVSIVTCIGFIRPYKGIELACEAVKKLGDSVYLLVAGEPLGDEAIEMSNAIAGVAGISVIPRRLTDQEFADFLHVTDVVLLPYLRVTGSAALLSALSFGRAVVASDLPFFREILGPHAEAGRLCKPKDASSLALAIEDMLAIPVERREVAARRLADSYSWDSVIGGVVTSISAWCKD